MITLRVFQKPIKTKKNQQNKGGFTNKNLFFLVRFCFYLFLKDAQRMLFS